MSEQSATPAKSIARWLITAGLVLALVCAVAAVFSGVGYRLGLWHFRTGFQIIRWAFFGGLAAAILAVIGLIVPSRRSGARIATALIAIVVGGVTAYIPWSWKQTLDAHPYIHDITTDLENPPAFVAVAGIRKEGDHPVAYDGPEVAEQQRKAYPDLAPLLTSAAPAQVFDKAKTVVAELGLELVDANPQEGRIEATQTTLLYGFKDDVVIRIVTTPNGTRVDVRSKSRVGRSDLAQNAKRIRILLANLKTALGETG